MTDPAGTGARRYGNGWAYSWATSPLVTRLTSPESSALAELPPWYATYTSPVAGGKADFAAIGENEGTGPGCGHSRAAVTPAPTRTTAAAAAAPMRMRRRRPRCGSRSRPAGAG